MIAQPQEAIGINSNRQNNMRTLLLLLLTLWTAQARAEVYALIVGINTYDGTANNLNSAVRDAQSVYNFFREKAPAENIVLLTDRQATRSNIIARMNEVFARATKDDIVVFYFSGHGMQGYFCPYDVQGGNRGLSHSDVKQAFKRSPAGTKLCIADACFSGSIRAKKGQTASSSPNYRRSNVVVIMSSRPSETSIEQNNAYGGGSGLFTKYLLLALRGEADKNHDRRISVEELYRYLRHTIRTESKQRQTPVLYGNVSQGSIVTTY